MEKLFVIKIGGNIIDSESSLSLFMDLFSRVRGKKILIHGGGKLATRLAADLNIPQQMVDGRRITDAETLRIVTMVYAGLINKTIVAGLQSRGSNAMGLTGADGNAIQAHKRVNAAIDYGFAGDVDIVNVEMLSGLLEQNLDLVFAPITHDKQGQLLNTNADTIAQEIAKGLCKKYEVQLIYSFEKAGVLTDANDDNTVIRSIDPASYLSLKEKNIIFAGMIPKLDNAFAAIQSGVSRVIIGKAEQLGDLINGSAGTTITAGSTNDNVAISDSANPAKANNKSITKNAS
ncbi:MAG: acetylglutamate kinase [Chitinophagaceae bacterium]|nr:MAG: acetylglutamate kinase [Chitinophagaceae bacterium]